MFPSLADRTQGQGRPSIVEENPFKKRDENLSGHHPSVSITLAGLCSLSFCRICCSAGLQSKDREVKLHPLLLHVALYMSVKA